MYISLKISFLYKKNIILYRKKYHFYIKKTVYHITPHKKFLQKILNSGKFQDNFRKLLYNTINIL